MKAKEDNHDDLVLRPRRIPILSRIAFFPVQLIFGTAHYVIATVAPQFEPTASVFVASGFFGALPLVLLGFVWLIGKALERVFGLPSSLFWRWTAAPFFALYFVNIILLDQTHTVVKNSGAVLPKNPLEQGAADFLWSFTRYIDNYITCVPWSKGAQLTTTTTTTTTTTKADEADDETTTSTFIFGCHPHGIHCTALIELSNPYNDFAKHFPNVSGLKLTGLAATVIFKIPVVRELFLFMGYIDASRSVASKALAAGQSLFLCIGGEEESLWTTPGKDIFVLQHRKGFVRLALSYGSSLVPVLGIGTNDAYTTYKPLFGLRMWIQKNLGVALPIFHGRWFTPLPHPIPIQIVVGEPIPTPQPKVPGERPSEELVHEYHTKYIEAVRSLHAKHAPKITELIIK